MLEPFLRAAGLDDVIADPRFNQDAERARHKDELDEAIRPWLLAHDAADIIAMGQAAKAPVGPGRHVRGPPRRSPARRSGRARRADAGRGESSRTAPGLRRRRPARRAAALAAGARRPTLPAGRRCRLLRSRNGARAEGPLGGLRVLDLTRVWARSVGDPHPRRSGCRRHQGRGRRGARGPAEVEPARRRRCASTPTTMPGSNRSIAARRSTR